MTAPAVRLLTSCFWKISNRMTSGTMAMMVPASDTLTWSIWVSSSCLRPIWTVLTELSLPVTSNGHRYWFHEARKLKTPRAAMAGRVRGIVTVQRKRRRPYPSSSAASRRSRGNPRKRLPQQEGPELSCHERNGEPLKGVVPP